MTILKNGATFWKCWQSKSEQTKKYTQVDGCVEANIIAGKFAKHFEKSYSCNNQDRADLLKQEYSKLRDGYSGLPLPDNVVFDSSIMISKLKRGKAAGIDGLMAEQLMFTSYPILPVILSKLFNLMLSIHYVQQGFKRSYIVPIPTPKDYYSKPLKCDDFRGIAISPILSKAFE